MELKRYRAGPPDFKGNPTRIYLSHKTSTKKNIELLRDCHMLKELYINGYDARDLDTDPLHGCPNLEALQISKAQNVSSLDLSPLSAMHGLKELFLVNIPNLSQLDLSPLSECGSLQRLWLGGYAVDELDIRPVLGLQDLEVLYIEDMPITELVGTSNKSRVPLRVLYIDSLLKLQSLSLEFLSHACLERIRIQKTSITEIDLSPLTDQRNIQGIYLENHQITNIDLSPLDSFCELSDLDLACNQLIHIDLAPLERCTSLRNIDLSSNKLQSIDLTPLSSLQIDELYLSRNEMREVDITPVVSRTLGLLTFGPDTIARASHTKKSSTRIGEQIGPTRYKYQVFVQYYHDVRKIGARTAPDLSQRRGFDAVEWY